MIQNDLVALAFSIRKAPGPRDFSREDGDHLYAAVACAAGSGDFYRRRRAQLGLAAAGDGIDECCCPQSDHETGINSAKTQEAASR